MKKYNEEHEWIEIQGDTGIVGVSQYAIEQLGDITFLELPPIQKEFNKGDSVAFIESVKAASDIYTPISGTILETNDHLLDNPESLNEDAKNIFIFKIKIKDPSEIDSLMNEEAYSKYLETL